MNSSVGEASPARKTPDRSRSVFAEACYREMTSRSVVRHGAVELQDSSCGVALAGRRYVPRTAVFVRSEFVSNNNSVADLGGQTDRAGWPVVDPSGLTTARVSGRPETPPARSQVITAAGEGSAARSPSTTSSLKKTSQKPSKRSAPASPHHHLQQPLERRNHE